MFLPWSSVFCLLSSYWIFPRKFLISQYFSRQFHRNTCLDLSFPVHKFRSTTLTLMINLLGLSIRILSVYFGIPHYGITGYLWGLFISQLAVCLVALLTLSHEIKKEYLQSFESATD